MSAFLHIVEAVRALKPGQELQVARGLLEFPTPPPFSPADWVLESIIGAAYEFSHHWDPVTGNVTFRRAVHPIDSEAGLRTYVSPDRLHYFTKRPDGPYELVREKCR